MANKLVETVLTAGAATLGGLALVSFLLGTEPQITKAICNTDNVPTRDFTYGEYMQTSVEHNGDSYVTRALTTVAYPGARVGRS